MRRAPLNEVDELVRAPGLPVPLEATLARGDAVPVVLLRCAENALKDGLPDTLVKSDSPRAALRGLASELVPLFLVAFLPKAAIFFGVCGSDDLRLAGTGDA